MHKLHLLTFNSLIFLLFSITSFSYAEESLFYSINAETEIEISVYPAKGDTLFLWLYSEAGPQKSEHTISKQLAKNNIEVWHIDLFAAHFLPVATSSMDRIPGSDISELIEYAFKKTGKKIIPVTSGRGSLPVLKGANLWQNTYNDSLALTGVILLSPKFFVETPEPGKEGKLLDIVKQTNLPIFTIQPQQSPWYWKLDKTIPALEKSGSDVFVQRIKGVRDRFYFRPDASPYENKITQQLPLMLKRAANHLKKLPYKKRKVAAVQNTHKKIIIGKKERSLSVYKGSAIPAELILKDLNNKTIDLSKLKGKVVLVNFWASWCPPCVHEMPSMQRLQNRFFAKGFTILGVNMAEDEITISQFLKTKVNVKFPILLDKEGIVLKRWGVFAFPTSYVIDKKGKIRYAIFGGVNWEQESITQKISLLLNE